MQRINHKQENAKSGTLKYSFGFIVADYGVNINLRVKGQSGLDRLNAKVKELTKSVDSIRVVDIMNPRIQGVQEEKVVVKQ